MTNTAIDPTKRDKIYDLLVKLKEQDLVEWNGSSGTLEYKLSVSTLINDAFNQV